MISKEVVRTAVGEGLKVLNAQLPAARRVADDDTAALTAVDSLDMITLIVAIEERLQAISPAVTGLATEESFFSRAGRPATVGDLFNRIASLPFVRGGTGG